MTMTMRRRLLLTTAAAGLIVSGGIAAAQDRPGDDGMRSHSPKAAQSESQKSKNERATSQDADKTNGQRPDDQSRANADNSKASTSGGSNADRSRSQNGMNNRADQKDSTTAGEKANGPNGQSAAETNERKQPSAVQSNKPNPSSASQTTPSTERQPSNAKTGQSREPAAAAQQPNTDRNAASSTQNAASPSRDQDTNAGHAQSSTRVSATLQGSDKTRLSRAVAEVHIRPVSSVNFSVSIGTAVPNTVTLHPVPTEVVAVIPQYRGYDFFIVRNEFVIVEPQTHKIVDVIERSGGRAEATTTTRSKLNLSQKDRSYIRKQVTTRTTTTGAAPRSERRITIGEDIPESVEIDSFPEDIYREVPAVRSYRYIRSGHDVYLVEPGSRRVIESIGDED
jgi:hypothetical protein